MLRTIPATALLAAFLAAPGGAQTHPLRNYSEDDGLPSSTVNDVAQDPSGRMWFATRSGIAVHDGRRLVTQNEGLPVFDYFRIAVDEAGTV